LPASRRLDTPNLFAVAAAVFGVLFMFPFHRRSRSHEEELREVAKALGLAFEEGKVKVPRGLRPGAPLFERWVRCENRLSGKVDGAAAAMFDLTTIRGHGEGETHQTWTVLVFSESPRLPDFVCVPRSWTAWTAQATLTPIRFDPRAGDAMTRRTVAAFEKTYVLGLSDTLAASAEGAVRRLFCAPRLEAMAQCPWWYVQSADGLLVFALDRIAPAAERPALWSEAVELRRGLRAPVSPAVAPIPAAPGMDVDHQRNRREGRRAGGWVGAMVGFFGSFLALASFLFSRTRPPPALFLGSPLIGMSALVVGALLGARLGGCIADLRYRPAPKEAPAPRISFSNGWVLAGALLGSVVGMAIGMGLTMVVMRPGRPTWAIPILFFSPPFVCLVLGGFAGLRFARRRAAQRTGK
jgi:hypothetical protein